MERKLSRRKMLRRKYKHYAAALAGAAIMTGAAGAALPSTTFAAENPNVHPIKVEQAMADSSKASASYDTRYNDSARYDTRSENGSKYDTRYNNKSTKNVTRANNDATYADRHNTSASYDTRYENNGKFDTRYHNRDGKYDTRYNNREGWHKHNNSWPSSNENRGLYKDGQIYYSSDNNRYNDYYEYGNYQTSPLTFAKDYASRYGFDANRDSFSLLSQSRHRATVQVVKHDTNQRFKIDLVRSQDGDWSITGVRGTGDTNYAATYR